MNDFDRVELLNEGGRLEWRGTWKEFVDDNVAAGMEREEIEGVAVSLARGEMHMFGGAGAFFGLRKIEVME